MKKTMKDYEKQIRGCVRAAKKAGYTIVSGLWIDFEYVNQQPECCALGACIIDDERVPKNKPFYGDEAKSIVREKMGPEFNVEMFTIGFDGNRPSEVAEKTRTNKFYKLGRRMRKELIRDA